MGAPLGAEPTKFKVGDKVSFEARGETIVGFVKQVNVKTVSVNPVGSTNGRYWRVSPNLLTKVQ